MAHEERPVNGDECDWVSKGWRRALCVFRNTTGLGKRVKRAINKRARRNAKRRIRSDSGANS